MTQTTKTIYETGATSHAVNDLILFTNNTRFLAEERDRHYARWAERSGWSLSLNKQHTTAQFKYLLRRAIDQYNKELGYTYSYNTLSQKQINEYARLYINDFESWKQEHNIQS